MRWIRRLAVACAVAGVSAAAAPSAAQGPALEELLRRTAAHVQQFVDDLTNVVAEEEYVQQFRQAAGRRRLLSDFLLVRYPGEEKLYQTFRDVMRVNDRPVQDQSERLVKLFLEPFDSAVRRAGEIHRASARHSLERGRLVDPLEAIAFLQAAYHDNFTFTLRTAERQPGEDVRRVDYEQIVPPGAATATLIRASAWIVESTGRVARTELRIGTGVGVRFTTTTFGVDPALRIHVPLEMQDVVPMGGADEFRGVARYRNFRRFSVRAEQSVDLPPAQR